jgi:hypothetical protein
MKDRLHPFSYSFHHPPSLILPPSSLSIDRTIRSGYRLSHAEQSDAERAERGRKRRRIFLWLLYAGGGRPLFLIPVRSGKAAGLRTCVRRPFVFLHQEREETVMQTTDAGSNRTLQDPVTKRRYKEGAFSVIPTVRRMFVCPKDGDGVCLSLKDSGCIRCPYFGSCPYPVSQCC